MSGLLPSSRLSAHFTARELQVDKAGTPAGVVDNARRLAAFLEHIRSALGNIPLRVTSGYRPASYNAAVGGVPTSSHQTGEAADVVPLSPVLTLYQVFKRLESAGLPAFDQIIFYPVEGHIHVGIGPKMRREFRIRLYEGPGGTPLASESTIARLPGYIADAGVSIATAVGGEITGAAVKAGASPVVGTAAPAVGVVVLVALTLWFA